MTYELTQEQEILRETIRDFANSEIAPLGAKIDQDCKVPQELLGKLPQLGLYGISVPSELGGAGTDFLSLIIGIEEISKASGSLGSLLSFHNAVVCEALSSSENSKLRENLLPRLTSGVLGAFDFSTLSHSNKSKQISCRIEGSELVVRGALQYIVGAASAGVFLMLGNLEGANEKVIFAFSKEETSKESFEVGEVRKLLGMRAAGTAGVTFHDLSLSLDSLVYEIPKVRDEIGGLLARARLAVAAQALGIAQASIDASVKYANERTQFNTKIGNFYAIQDMIASDSVDLETARALTYLTAQEMKSKSSLERDSSNAKIAASNSAVKASRHAIRVHGGYGFTRDYPVERYARDARVTQVYTESNEDLKGIIARSLLQ